MALGLASGAVTVLLIESWRTPGGFQGYVDPHAWARPMLSLLPVAVLAVLTISAVNAVAEEWIFRRLILGEFLGAGLPPLLAIGISSLSFGAAHASGGLPGGPSGFLLAGAFGAVMGTAYVRQPDARPFVICAHFAADVIIIGHALLS